MLCLECKVYSAFSACDEEHRILEEMAKFKHDVAFQDNPPSKNMKTLTSSKPPLRNKSWLKSTHHMV